MVDSLKIFDILKTANLPENEARAVTQAIQQAETALTEDFKAFVRSEIGRLEQNFEQRFDTLETRFATKAELSEMKASLIGWMFVFWIGSVGTTAAIVFGMVRLMR